MEVLQFSTILPELRDKYFPMVDTFQANWKIEKVQKDHLYQLEQKSTPPKHEFTENKFFTPESAEKNEMKPADEIEAASNPEGTQLDGNGYFELYLFKNIVTKNFRTDEHLCMWRREGAKMLQKFCVIKPDPDENELMFRATRIYSCWPRWGKYDFFKIKVAFVGDEKHGRVKIVDLAGLVKRVEECVAEAADQLREMEEEDERLRNRRRRIYRNNRMAASLVRSSRRQLRLRRRKCIA